MLCTYLSAASAEVRLRTPRVRGELLWLRFGGICRTCQHQAATQTLLRPPGTAVARRHRTSLSPPRSDPLQHDFSALGSSFFLS